jgi:hypothetical protein
MVKIYATFQVQLASQVEDWYYPAPLSISSWRAGFPRTTLPMFLACAFAHVEAIVAGLMSGTN